MEEEAMMQLIEEEPDGVCEAEEEARPSSSLPDGNGCGSLIVLFHKENKFNFWNPNTAGCMTISHLAQPKIYN